MMENLWEIVAHISNFTFHEETLLQFEKQWHKNVQMVITHVKNIFRMKFIIVLLFEMKAKIFISGSSKYIPPLCRRNNVAFNRNATLFRIWYFRTYISRWLHHLPPRSRCDFKRRVHFSRRQISAQARSLWRPCIFRPPDTLMSHSEKKIWLSCRYSQLNICGRRGGDVCACYLERKEIAGIAENGEQWRTTVSIREVTQRED